MSQPRVIHVLRAPVGGLFRHVRDLVGAQSAMGLSVGVICDSSANDSLTASRLAALEQHLGLGLHKVRMSREIGTADVSAYRSTRKLAIECNADILHGHGAKGGAYARLAAAALRKSGHNVRCLYTPHGGSLHYDPASLKGRVFMALERRLAALTDGLIFESAYSQRIYQAKVGEPSCRMRVIPNGLLAEEFSSHRPLGDAADVLFVGELRRLKGVDVLLEALASMPDRQSVTALIVGEGPDRAAFEGQAAQAGLSGSVTFAGAMPARDAFPRGRVLAMPSRAESFPYIVLEAAAAGMPMIATDVGGIPEIVAGSAVRLLPPGDAAALASALSAALGDPGRARSDAADLQRRVADQFMADRMAADVVAFYAELTAR